MDPTALTSPRPPRARRRLPLIVGVILVVLACGWTAAWMTARTRLDDLLDARLAVLAAKGVTIVCPDREVGGFPFRMEITCRGPTGEVARNGLVASTAALRIVAQIWNPRFVIAEFDGPIEASTAAGERFVGTWRSLRLSVRWALDGVERVSIVAEGLDATATPATGVAFHAIAEHLEGHGRTTGAEARDADLALSFTALQMQVAGRQVGPKQFDGEAGVTLAALLPMVRGREAEGFAARGGRIDPIRLTVASGGVTIAGKGALRLENNGLVDGAIGFAARGLESLAGGGARNLGPEATTALGAFALLGKPSSDPDLPGRRLDLVIEQGRPRFGRLVLSPIAPLFVPSGS